MYRPFPVRVAERIALSRHFIRIVFTGDELGRLGWDGPDQRIKLVFTTRDAPGPDVRAPGASDGSAWYAAWRTLPDDIRPPMRTYTTRAADPANRRLVVDFVAHGDTGPATRWAQRARPGDELVVVAPDASDGEDSGGHEWHPGDATTLLIAADESAVPAAASIVETLGPDARGAVFLEVPSAVDRLPLPAPPGIAVTWLPRDGRSHGVALTAAVRAWAAANIAAGVHEQALAEQDPGPDEILWEVPDDRPDGGIYAWLAGEAGVITALRRHLVTELGVDRRRVAFMGYWKQGRAESD